MSGTTKKDVGYPKSEEEAIKYLILRFCGGAGGGGCVTLLGATQFVYPIRVSKLLTYNKSLTLDNLEFTGVDIFTDGGSVPFCDHSPDVRQPFWLGFSDDGILTDGEVKKQDIQITGAPPHQIFIQGNKLPQPVLRGGGINPNWENRIYVHIVWNSSSFVSVFPLSESSLGVVKHNQDLKI